MRQLSWFDIVRLGCVQMALGAIVVLTTSTLNRLMVVEFALPAVVPALLVGLHYGIQITRPSWGFRSDKLGNRTPWIIGGVGVLAIGGFLAAWGVTLLEASLVLGLSVSVFAYALIGIGVGASGTSLLALLATSTAHHRRAAAATITWLMMIFGIAMTAGIVGSLLDPYSPTRLLTIVAAVVSIATLLTIVVTFRIERGLVRRAEVDGPSFSEALAEVWGEREARNFTIFVFLSMTAYFMQELILEPYAGLVFNFTPGQSTSLSGAQNGGVFVGMLLVGIAATGLRMGSLRAWVVAGCLGSAAALVFIALLAGSGPLVGAVVTLGFFNGMFAVAAIGSMMALAGEGREKREGTRMGLWGASQAVAAGVGALIGTSLVDIFRQIGLSDATAYGGTFLIEALIFLSSAALALRIMSPRAASLVQAVPGE